MLKKSKQLSFGGIVSALSLILMFASAMLPMLEYTSPALAGAVLGLLVIEIGKKTAVIAYIAVSVLSFFIVPNKEVLILFIGFFGFYPILKSVIEKINKTLIRRIVKWLTFNTAIVLSYIVIINVLGLTQVTNELGMFGEWAWVVLLVIGNAAFVVYDIALSKGYEAYIIRLSKILKIR